MDEKIIIEKDGKKVECDLLFSFDSDDYSKTFIGYTDHSKTYNGAENIYISAIDIIKGTGKPEPVTDPDEIALVNEFMEQMIKEIKAGER